MIGWHLVGETGGRVSSVHRETPSYLNVQHSDVVNDLGLAFYWNAPGLYLGNKVRCGQTVVFIYTSIISVIFCKMQMV